MKFTELGVIKEIQKKFTNPRSTGDLLATACLVVAGSCQLSQLGVQVALLAALLAAQPLARMAMGICPLIICQPKEGGKHTRPGLNATELEVWVDLVRPFVADDALVVHLYDLVGYERDEQLPGWPSSPPSDWWPLLRTLTRHAVRTLSETRGANAT